MSHSRGIQYLGSDLPQVGWPRIYISMEGHGNGTRVPACQKYTWDTPSGGFREASCFQSQVYLKVFVASKRPKGVNQSLSHYLPQPSHLIGVSPPTPRLPALSIRSCFTVHPWSQEGRQVPLKLLAPHGTSQQGCPIMSPSVHSPPPPKKAPFCYEAKQSIAAPYGNYDWPCFFFV